MAKSSFFLAVGLGLLALASTGWAQQTPAKPVPVKPGVPIKTPVLLKPGTLTPRPADPRPPQEAKSAAKPGTAVTIPLRVRTAKLEVVGSGIAAAPLPPFAPLRIRTGRLEVVGDGTAAAPLAAFQPLRIRTSTLEVVGSP